ncbi:hybrid sensor histidine kinase/response regulator transcription factor [Thermophagus xiamenensis]|uniref:histidine kinase n=1 Tax=Thermophagus xiamenensis TaxID=385682 RepID=A0A1I1XEJ2_9BACT|nr:hybrid sensor histidine kinase/response regulator transcription factor [Thermophagus xiamenensis]SFE05765.1 Signal transduction histidine kinase [Thermophagus xiamenensis]
MVTVRGQAPRFDHFDISGGLSQNNINGLVIDDKGNVWVGTLDGLNKFNGYEFEIFKPQYDNTDGVSGNHIIAMGKGVNGDVWITTREGVLNQYRSAVKRFRHFPDSIFSALGVAPVQNLLQQNDSLLWFSQDNKVGLLNINDQNGWKYNASAYVSGLTLKGDSLLTFGRFGIEYLSVEDNNGNISIKSHLLKKRPCYHLQRDENEWYMISDRGIEKWSDNLTVSELVVDLSTLNLSIRPSQINCFAVYKGVFWIGDDNLLDRIRPQGNGYMVERFSYNPENDFSFKGYYVTHLQFDSLGNLWIGTRKNGLNHFNYRKNRFLHYNWNRPLLNSPDTDPVRAICKRNNGEIWLGFDRKGVGIIDSEGRQHYLGYFYLKDGSKRVIRNVRNIFEDSYGNIWVGEASRLCIYNESRKRLEAVSSRFSWTWPYHCYSIKEFEPGILTITSSQKLGMVNLETGELTQLNLNENNNGLPGIVREVVKDKYGNLWIAKDENGLLKFEKQQKRFKTYQRSSHNLSDNKIYCLLPRGDSLWIGTNAGLNLFSISGDSVVNKYFEKDGLSNNIVYSLLRDSKGNLWMSTNRGITHFYPDEEQFYVFLANDFFMDDAWYADKDGYIFYGGYTGVVGFHPDSIVLPHLNIRAGIESFYLFNREILPGDSLGNRILINQPLQSGSEIKLKHNENSFSIRFNAYPFDYPNHNVFRYRLLGLQNEWIYPAGTIREASYTVVPPGEYIFELQAGSNRQTFGPSLYLKIVVIPPFWRTTWFKGAMILLLLGLIFGGYQIRLQQIHKRNLLLKSRVEEQTKELRERNQQILEMSQKLHEADQSKLQFFTNISHDFRTPLTLILAHLDQIDHNKKRAVRTIRNNARRLMNMIDQLIDLRKLDQGKLKLSVSKFDVVGVVKDIVGNFQPLAEQKNVNIQFYSSNDTLEVWLDMDKLEKITGNLLSNAIKYSGENSSVMVTVGEESNAFYIEVEDSGPGISKEELERIFDRFYRVTGTGNKASGHGIGLTIVKGLTELQKGRVEVSSTPGKGTRFRLKFLKGRDHFKEEDFGTSSSAAIFYDEPVVEENFADDFSRYSDQKIVIVEDNRELSAFLKEVLDNWFQVKVAYDGKQALSIIRQFEPDLIISDIMMPGMDGIALCREIKANNRTSNIPFILLTARTDEEIKIEGFDLGIDDYIEKPFNTRVLLARLKSILENRQKLMQNIQSADCYISAGAEFSKEDKSFLNSVNSLIENNFSDASFNVEVLSKMLFMSRSSFYRKFKSLTGMTAADYLRKIRLHKAVNLIRYEEMPVGQIAENVGFQSVAHFRKSFKNEFGATPGEWSKKHKAGNIRS